jgi:hypothetical protein
MEFIGSTLYTMLWQIDPQKVKDIYYSEIQSFIRLHSNIPLFDNDADLPPIIEIIVICSNIYDVFLEKRTHIKTIRPFGYQKSVEFYAPKYDTPEARGNSAFDMRTTVHRQPVVQTDSTGMAVFDFYAADAESSYTVIIEGVTAEGKIIRKEGKLWRRDDEKRLYQFESFQDFGNLFGR